MIFKSSWNALFFYHSMIDCLDFRVVFEFLPYGLSCRIINHLKEYTNENM